jgi:TetR/AcrR family transcriptional regulator, transcriptional repressor for nem operon
MPKRSIEHANESRERIISSASALMRANGYDGVGIDKITEQAGLTAGAFYRHFASKQVLFEEVVSRAMQEASEHMPRISTTDDIQSFVAAYLAQRKFKQVLTGCVVAAMAPDLTRNGQLVQLHAAHYVQSIHSAMTRVLTQFGEQQAEDIAWQIMSGAVGGLVLARLMGAVVGAKIDSAVMNGTRRQMNALK